MKWLVLLAAVWPCAEGSMFETAFKELQGCHLSMGSCLTTRNQGYVFATSKEACLASPRLVFGENISWYMAYNSSAALAADVASAPAGKAVLVRLRDGASVASLQKALKGSEAQASEFLFCAGSTWATLSAEVATASSVVALSMPLPKLLTMSPLLSLSSNSSSFARVVKLSPGLAPRAVQTRWETRLSALGRGRSLAVEPARQLGTASSGGGPAKARPGVLVVRAKDRAAALELDEFVLGAPETLWVAPQAERVTSNFDAAQNVQSGYKGAAEELLRYPAQGTLAQPASRTPLWSKGIRGQNQIVGVGDSGLDMESCFFSDRAGGNDTALTLVRARGPNNTVYNYPTHRKVVQYAAYADGITNEIGAHGTHVAGSVAGSLDESSDLVNASLTRGSNTIDSKPANYHQGMAPEARIAFFDMGKWDVPRSIFPPEDYGEMFEVARSVGAFIHTNSWGGYEIGYDTGCQSMDRYVFEHQDFLPLFAAGNQGREGEGSVGSPATAKNLVSVGAAAASSRSWALLQGDLYKIPSLTCNSNANGAIEQCGGWMAEFSSTGPTHDGRIKPDVAAPGQYIFSASSSRSQSSWNITSVGIDNFATGGNTCNLTPKAGTSMATPVTAGAVALVRQFFMDGFYPSGTKNAADAFVPMGALLKAMLINGAGYMSGNATKVGFNGANSTFASFKLGSKPDMYQGFGEIKLTGSVKVDGNKNGEHSVVIDGDMAKMPTFSATGQRKTYSVYLGNATANMMRATLVWFEPEAALAATRVLVNDLDLTVTAPNGKVYFPNGAAAADRLNTVEQVDVPARDIVPGFYTVEVFAYRLGRDDLKQPFAVVISGDFSMAPTTAPTTAQPTAAQPAPAADTNFTLIGGVVAGVLLLVIALALFRRRAGAPASAGTVENALASSTNPKYGRDRDRPETY
jgi:hypothetical protein